MPYTITGKPSSFPPSSHNHDSLYQKVNVPTRTQTYTHKSSNDETVYINAFNVGEHFYFTLKTRESNQYYSVTTDWRCPTAGQYAIYDNGILRPKVVSTSESIAKSRYDSNGEEYTDDTVLLVRIS